MVMSLRGKTVTKKNLKCKKCKDTVIEDIYKCNKTFALLDNSPYRMLYMYTTNKQSKVNSQTQSIFVNKVPKSIAITPVKWKSNNKPYKLPYPSLNSREAVFKQERTFETLLRYLPYEQLVSYRKFFPFCNQARYASIQKRVLLFQFIFVRF